MHIPIIFEDESFLVVDKPAGVVVNKAESVKEMTVQEWAEKKLVQGKTIDRAGIIHRLDKETSGLLLIAKEPETFLLLQAQFKERVIQKKYLTLVHGKVVPPQGEVKATVGRLPWNRERFGILPGGREAVTNYQVKKYYQREKDYFSYLEVTPQTGRTHQIRIHLKYLGHPVVSDQFYAGRKTAAKDRLFCPRLFLHAFYLRFKHPKTAHTLEINSPLPEELRKVLEEQLVVCQNQL